MPKLALRNRLRAAHTRRRMPAFYAGFVERGDLVFDVGANVGDVTAVFRGLGARVVAVEPQGRCVAQLRERFDGDPDVIVVAKGLGAEEGDSTLHVAGVSTIATMQPGWIEATTASGRFSEFRWDEQEVVEVTTLDRLIAEHGVPAFCKIDVEGGESEVLAGLSRPVRALSFEFHSEYLGNAERCVARLAELGAVELNYCRGGTVKLVLDEWVGAERFLSVLRAEPDAGDAYARFR